MSKILQRWRRTGSVTTTPMGADRRSGSTEAHGPGILALLEGQPDLTLDETCAAPGPAGAAPSRVSIWRFSAGTGSASKETAHAAEQARPDVQTKRQRWRQEQRQLTPERLVFLDETWASTAMARPRGRTPRGERLVSAVPHGHWKTTTFVAGLRQSGVVASLVLDGPMNGEVFRAYVEQMLWPTLQPGDVVVMDNLSAHKGLWHPPGHQGARRQACLSAVVLPRPEPDRAALRQAQGVAAQRGRLHRQYLVGSHRCAARELRAPTNAPTTSATPDMVQTERNLL